MSSSSDDRFAQWRNTVQDALRDSATDPAFTEKLRTSEVGNINRRVLTQICQDLLTKGSKAQPKEHDSLEDGVMINTSRDEDGNEVIDCEAEGDSVDYAPLTQAQSSLLEAFATRLTQTHKYCDLSLWFKFDSRPALSRKAQNSIHSAVLSILNSMPSYATTPAALLDGIVRNIEDFVQCENLDAVFRARATASCHWCYVTDEQKELLLRGAKHLKEFGDLPGWIEQERTVIREAQTADTSKSHVQSLPTRPGRGAT